MRSILFSTALVLAAVLNTGCATLKLDQGCGVDNQGGTAGVNCCNGPRIGGLLGRLRGEGSCVDCGNVSCPDGNCGVIGGRIGNGMGARGVLAGGFGRVGGECNQFGLMGGDCGMGNQEMLNHAPYTGAFHGPAGPQTGHFSYPYYTTRAPRDFLMANPPSIGR
ncbi:MAG: hypothetical protein VX768_13925 [Planctomycetota bacterium]|nr:hypothetical protein [Planctomycetota bacterium]